MGDAVCNDLDSEALSVADRFLRALAVTHYARKLHSLGDPAAVFLPLKVDRQFHSFIILPPVSAVRSRYGSELLWC